MIDCDTDKLQKIFGRGLSPGIGHVDGKMCVEAAIAVACGEGFSDKPTCVAGADRSWSIRLNGHMWPTAIARADALWPVALAQLGTQRRLRSKWSKLLLTNLASRLLPLALEDVAVVSPTYSEELVSISRRLIKGKGVLDILDAAKAASRLLTEIEDSCRIRGYGYYMSDVQRVAVRAVRTVIHGLSHRSEGLDTVVRCKSLLDSVLASSSVLHGVDNNSYLDKVHYKILTLAANATVDAYKADGWIPAAEQQEEKTDE